MELKIVIDGLDTALADLKQRLVDLNGASVVQHNELLSKIDSQAASLALLLEDGVDINTKLDAVHTMLSHIADTQAAHGVQLNAIMAGIQELRPVDPPPVEHLPLIGVNFAGMANSGHALPGSLGTHYRSILDRAGIDYVQMHAGHLNGEPWLARLPILMERMFDIGSDGTYVMWQSYMNELLDVIDAVHAGGGQCLIDVHNYCRWFLPTSQTLLDAGFVPQSSTVNGETFSACHVPIGHALCPVNYDMFIGMWRQLAGQLEGYAGVWGLGLMNEPNGTPQADWFARVQDCINSIRQVNDKHWITVGGGGWSTAKHWRTHSDPLKNLVDPADKLMFEAHQYPDGPTGEDGGKWNSPTTPIDPVARVNDWRDWILWLQENNLRGVAGEFGGPGTTTGMQEYFTALYDLFEQHRIPCFQWLAGPGDSDAYPNGMDSHIDGLKPNAQQSHLRIGRTCTSYGPRV